MQPNKFAIVTGAATGLGHSIVLALAEQGWTIAFTYLHNHDAAAELTAAAEGLGAKVLAVESDVGFKPAVDAFHDAAAAFGGIPDLLVNNAGVQTWSSLLDLEEEAWDRVIRTNLKGCFLNTQNVARRMAAAGKGGSIVNLGSGCNHLAFPKLVDYTASKGGIEQFTKVAAVELGPLGIRVNCVAPGAIETARTLQETGDYAATWSKITPLRRVGYGADVADAVLYLASPGAAFISGQTLGVDGAVFAQANWPYAPGDTP